MNSLLKRQLKKQFGDATNVPPECRALVEAVDQAYSQFDADRNLLERSLDLSSSELLVANAKMRSMVESLQKAHDELEDKVAERTAELSSSNKSLEREINERMRAEVARLQVEAKFRTLVEQMPAITYMADPEVIGQLQYVSPQILTVTGFTADEWLASPDMFRQRLHNEDRDRVFAELTRCRKIQTAFECEYRLMAKDGHVVWCLDQAVIHQDEGRTKRYLQGIITDITAQKNLEDQLRQSMKMEAIGKLAGGIAHDFNNILTAIIGDSYLIATQIEENHPANKHAESILASANRAASLTQQLLAYSRRQMLQPKIFDLGAQVIKLEGMLRRLIGEHIHLKTSLCCGETFVKADPGQIEQVLINLVINARDAINGGGSITLETFVQSNTQQAIGTTSVDESICIAITDTGCGMNAEVLAHLFEPFYTTKPQGKGTGLGLATCYGTIKQSGGTISVKSTPGVGTTFTIVLPRVRNHRVEPSPQTNHFAKMPRGSETVLIAEDETQVQQLAALTLRHLGYTVFTASNGEEALQMLEGANPHKIDLLLTDVIMPEMGGKELAQRLQQHKPTIPILFMSGYTADEIGHDDLECFESGFLQKPFSPVALASKIRETLNRPDSSEMVSI